MFTIDQQDSARPVKPFPRWRYLEQVVRRHWMAGGNHLYVKPRAAVMTTLFAALFDHALMFWDVFPAFAMSFKLPRIDDPGHTPNSFFGKMKATFDRLPSWQRAFGPLAWRHRMVVNEKRPDTNYVAAETAGTSTARGIQAARGLVDELAECHDGSSIMMAAMAACPSGLFLPSTPKGTGNEFYRLAHLQPKIKTASAFQRHDLQWWMVPDRRRCVNCESVELRQERATPDDPSGIIHLREDCKMQDGLWRDFDEDRWRAPWFDEKTASMTQAMIAQEYEGSFQRSTPGRVFAMYADHRQGSPFVREENGVTVVVSDNGFKREGWSHGFGWDFGIDDQTFIVCGQRQGERAEIFDEYAGSQVSYEHYCNWYGWLRGDFFIDMKVNPDGTWSAGDLWLPPRLEHSFRKAWGEPGRYTGIHIEHIGDPSGRGRDSTLSSWFDNLAKGAGGYGEERWFDRRGRPVVVGRIGLVGAYDDQEINRARTDFVNVPLSSVYVGIQVVAYALERNLLGISDKCPMLRDALTNYHWPTDTAGRVKAGKKPVHDQWSHGNDALRYLLVKWFGARGAVALPLR